MLKVKGKVVELCGDKVKVELESCSSCSSCGRRVVLIDDGEHKVGDIIELSCDERKMLSYALKVYCLPVCFGLFAIFFSKYILSFSDIYSALVGLFFMVFTFLFPKYK